MSLFGFSGDEVSDEYIKRIVVTILVAATTSTATFFAGRWWGRYRAGKQWAAKEFLDRIIVSLNIFADGYLKIRTVLERSVEEVFLNRLGPESDARPDLTPPPPPRTLHPCPAPSPTPASSTSPGSEPVPGPPAGLAHLALKS